MKKQGRLLQFFVSLLLLELICTGICVPVKADQIKNGEVFNDAQWQYMTEWSVSGTDWLQSMCETDKYIVCLQDSNVKGEPDTLNVFNRDTMELEFRVKDTDYEHGNGMTYNPNTNEIYIAPYFAKIKKNKGVIFVLDADTMEFKRRVKVSDGSWNAASIEYMENTDQYIIQSGPTDNFVFKIYDSNFNYIEDICPGDQSMGNQFQDFCVSGDYIISVPWMREDLSVSMLQVYSISQKAYLGAYQVNAPGAGTVYEAESICQSDKGEIILAIALSGTNRMTLYNTYVPVVYNVETSAENGEITPSSSEVDIGSDYKVEYSCTEDYELKQLLVDGEEQDIKEYPEYYIFGNIQADHNVWVRFTEIPKFDITTAVSHGTIDQNQVIRRDQDVTIHYQPDLHYEVDKILVDDQEVDGEEYATSYTFNYIQGPHDIKVWFKEIPSYVVSTKVYNGIITATNKKVYRDEDYTVNYEPENNYQMAYMKVDGQWIMEIPRDTVEHQYTFDNIQEGHEVAVYYQWKYLSWAILGLAFFSCIPMGLLYLMVTRIRNRRKYRNYSGR